MFIRRILEVAALTALSCFASAQDYRVQSDDRNESACLELKAAAIADDIEMIDDQLVLGVSIDCRNQEENNMTALMQAAEGASVNATRLLVERGAAVNALDDDGWTSLDYAQETRKVVLRNCKLTNIITRFDQVIMYLRNQGAKSCTSSACLDRKRVVVGC